MLNINKFRVVKAKERSIKARNKKDTITRIEKTKTKSTRRNLFDFKYIDVVIKVFYSSKEIVEKDKCKLQ